MINTPRIIIILIDNIGNIGSSKEKTSNQPSNDVMPEGEVEVGTSAVV